MGKDDPETAALKKELEDLINKCQVVGAFLKLFICSFIVAIVTYNFRLDKRFKEDQKKQQDAKIEEACASVGDPPKVKLSTKKLLKGHINKVNSVHFSGDSRSENHN